MPGEAAAFLAQLWAQLPPHPAGALLGAIHLAGDRGQIVVRANGPEALEFVVRPGQVLVAEDPADPGTWSVVEGPRPPRLNLPS